MVGFSLFILEESCQTSGFAAFYAKEAGAWDIVATAADTTEIIGGVGTVINYAVGWVNPFLFFSYYQYFNRAVLIQVAGIRALVEDAQKQTNTTWVSATSTITPQTDLSQQITLLSSQDMTVYVDKTVSVEVTVVDVEVLPKVAIASTDGTLILVAFPSSVVYGKIADLKGQTITVTGKIVLYNNAPEIILDNMNQVKLGA
jgi:putative Mn2+ efflux pump MntP